MTKLSQIDTPFGDLSAADQRHLREWPLRLQLKDSTGRWSTVWPSMWFDAYRYRIHPDDICKFGPCQEPVINGGRCKCHQE